MYVSLRAGTQVGSLGWPSRNARSSRAPGVRLTRLTHASPARSADASPDASARGRLRSQVLIMLLGLRWQYNLTRRMHALYITRKVRRSAEAPRAWTLDLTARAPPRKYRRYSDAHRALRTRLARTSLACCVLGKPLSFAIPADPRTRLRSPRAGAAGALRCQRQTPHSARPAACRAAACRMATPALPGGTVSSHLPPSLSALAPSSMAMGAATSSRRSCRPLPSSACFVSWDVARTVRPVASIKIDSR